MTQAPGPEDWEDPPEGMWVYRDIPEGTGVQWLVAGQLTDGELPEFWMVFYELLQRTRDLELSASYAWRLGCIEAEMATRGLPVPSP